MRKRAADRLLDSLGLTDQELEDVIVMLVAGGCAPAADVLGRRLRAKPRR